MKNVLLLTIIVFFCLNTQVFAQKLSAEETTNLRQENKQLKIDINDQMAFFVLKQEVSFYNQAILLRKQQAEILNKLITKGYTDNTETSRQWESLYQKDMKLNILFFEIFNDYWKDSIMKDNTKCKKKVTYKWEKYTISKFRMNYFETFKPL
jgi:hypothetical protein